MAQCPALAGQGCLKSSGKSTPGRELAPLAPSLLRDGHSLCQIVLVHEKSILAIDDDPAMLRALDKVLNGEGAVVTTAGGVQTALERLREPGAWYDLVLTDLRMRDGGGWKILEAVRTKQPQVPVIVITAFGSPRLRDECRALGAVGFLEKPLDTSQLMAAISFATERQNPRASSATRAPSQAPQPNA